jgi:hypothetical protein
MRFYLYGKERKGICVWPDGTKYEGKYINNCVNGKGIYSCLDGQKYGVKFNNDVIHGISINILLNNRYDARFEDDMINGESISILLNNRYNTSFEDDAIKFKDVLLNFIGGSKNFKNYRKNKSVKNISVIKILLYNFLLM